MPRLEKSKRWVAALTALAFITVFLVWLNMALFTRWSVWLFPDYFFISYYSPFEISLFFGAFLTITTLLKFSKSWFRVNDLRQKLLEAEKRGIQSELKALKAQINPHFFFNTLNSIYAMSLAKDDRLPGTVLQLSGLMRYLLYESKEDTMLLEKEISILADYAALQQIRSGDNLQFKMTLEGEVTGQRIAPFLLITFLENAFKHGAKGDIRQTYIFMTIKINQHNLEFRIENNKGSLDQVEKEGHRGLGLENVKRRLELLYPGRHQLVISEDDKSYIVQLAIDI
jgi:sensor histidine kinase YesM